MTTMASALAAAAGETTEVGVLRGGGAGGAQEPVRVMHVVYTLRPGGMEFGIVKLVNGLDRARVSSSICSTLPASVDMRAQVAGDVPVFDLQRRPGTDLRVVGDLYRLFRRERPDIVHTHAWGTLVEGLLAARLARVPFVVHGEHGTLQLRGYQRRVQRAVWARADLVLSVSTRLAEKMAETTGFPRERIRTIRNGVDLSRFGLHPRADARRALGLAPDAFVVGTAGRLVPVKDQKTLIAAMAVLRRAGHRLTLLIAGDGPLGPELEAAAAALGIAQDVRFLGHCPGIETVFAAMDVFVLSSVSEGLSNTILEAMASGLPVVATRVGGADELVADGLTGILVPAGSAESLAGAIARLMASAPQCPAMGAAGRRRAESEFSLPSVIRRYEQMYWEVARRSVTATAAHNAEVLS